MFELMKIAILCILVITWFPIQGYGHEETDLEIYGLQRGDPLEYVKRQAVKYGFDIQEERVVSEAGEELGIYLSKAQKTILIVVVFKHKVHWIDVLEHGITLGGITIGTNLFSYHQKQLPIVFLGHRDASLDDLVCLIGNVKTLIDWEYRPYIEQYRKSQDPNILKHIIIKGIEL